MPTYPLVNKITGEKKELYMTMPEYEQWRKDNPDWDKDWSAGVAGVGEVGDWRDKMSKSHPGWKDVMNKVKQVPGANIQGW
jgi:hypothetical protein